MLMDRQTDKNGQMNRWNNTNFESNLAMMNYLPVKFEFDWTKCFRFSPEMAMLTGSQRKGWNYTNFKSNLAMLVIYLPVKFEFDWTKYFCVRVWKRKC